MSAHNYFPAFPDGKRHTDQPYSKMITVIETHFRRGAGVAPDPVRMVKAYYHPDGTLLAEFDEWAEMTETRKGDFTKKPAETPDEPKPPEESE